MRLGRCPHDPARVAAALAARPHRYGAMPPPPRLDRGGVAFTPGLYRNDTLPDCTAAGLANAASAFGWVQSGAPPAIDPAAVPAFYAACVGNPPDLAATDGAVMLDVLDRAEAQGVPLGGQTALVPIYAAVAAADRAGLARAMAQGAAYCGVQLALADRAGLGGVWDAARTDAAGSWGGHCLIAWDYTGLGDDDIVRLGTWGGWQRATWRWVAARLGEAYALAWPQLLPPGGDGAPAR